MSIIKYIYNPFGDNWTKQTWTC